MLFGFLHVQLVLIKYVLFVIFESVQTPCKHTYIIN